MFRANINLHIMHLLIFSNTFPDLSSDFLAPKREMLLRKIFCITCFIRSTRRFDHQFTTSCGEKPRYTAWKKGQPDFYHGEENCGHMLTGGDIGKWNDIRCDRNYDYICEIKYPRCK